MYVPLGMEKANEENIEPPQTAPPAQPPTVPASIPSIPKTPMGVQVLVGIGLIGLVGGMLYRSGSRR